MADQGKVLTRKLLDLMQETGYALAQSNGQRKFGPPPNWSGPPPPKGCEIFIGKLPREIYEDELVPLFSKVGKIYEMRLMMDFSGSNRGYAFVVYTTRADAYKAIKELNGHEIRPGRNIGVVKSVDNCRLFVGGIPKTKTKEEIYEELSKRVNGIVDVILYKNCFDRQFNRGFAFVEFISHRAAAMARRSLIPGCVKLWDQEVMVDWAEPEPDVDDEQMKKVKVLYVRNFLMQTTAETIQSVFEEIINHKIERIKKIYDYAFIHFYKREHAELAMSELHGTEIDGSKIEIRWAKPVIREIYHIQKLNRGNAKFNHSLDLSQTMLLYKQHLDKKEYAISPKEDEGFGSTSAGESSVDTSSRRSSNTISKEQYPLAPGKLESICNRYMWKPPNYKFHNYIDLSGREIWYGQVDLQIGSPLSATPQHYGPLSTKPCSSVQQAHVEAAEMALGIIKIVMAGFVQSTPALATSTPVSTGAPPSLPQSLPQAIYPVVPGCVGLPYNYPIFQGPHSTIPTLW